MAKNEILPFGIGVDANVMPQAEYESLPARVGGFSSGVAKSEQLNIVWRQAAFMASMLAQFIADNSEQDVLDDGKIAELQIKLESAIKSYANSNLPSASTIQKGIVQLSSATNSTSETLAATPKAVKAAIDAALPVGGTAKAAEKLATARKISGIDFDGSKDITLPFINTTDDNIQLAGNLGVKNLEVRGYGTTEGGQIDFFDKSGALAASLDIDTNGNFRIINATHGGIIYVNRTSGEVSLNKNTSVNGTLSAYGNITSTNGHIIATNGNIACNNGNLYAGTGVASGLNVQATKNLIAGENLSVGGRGDITGDLRGGRVLSKSDVIVGEGQAGGYATINSTGNIIGSQWGNAWLSTRTARAFAVFNAKTGAVSGSVGISSVTRNAVGTYTVVFSSAMPGTYAVMVGVDGAYNTHEPTITSKTATSFRILTPADGGVDYSLQDLNEIQFVVFSTGV
ncbi:tail fiber protein [Yersinia proxima]|uniref:tail fiber protein n=1 Tax=Yersinia proxima TaxID=2890316 RepID=UPI001D12C529|nr:phage tail protein [Yersinia proxima]